MKKQESAPKPRRGVKVAVVIALAMAMLAGMMSAPGGTDIAEAQTSGGNPEQIETFALDHHPNGVQMRVVEIEHTAPATYVVAVVTNGRDFDTHIDGRERDTYLEDDRGNEYRLTSDIDFDLEPGQWGTARMKFEPVPETVDSISLFFRNNGRDRRTVREGFPSFEIRDIDLTGDTEAPALPASITEDEANPHPNGATVVMQEVSFTDNSINLKFSALNNSDFRVNFSSGRHTTYFEDDLGNRYYLKMPDLAIHLKVEEGRQKSGTSPFVGRIHPDATELSLIMNDDESETNDRERNPKFVFGPWEIVEGSGSGNGDELLPIAVDETQQHASGVELTITEITFDEDGASVAYAAENTNRFNRFLDGCCDSLYLEDDLGNQYLGEDETADRRIPVEPGESVEGTIRFADQIDAEATTLTLAINDRGQNDMDDERAPFPEFRFGPYDLERVEGDDEDDAEGDQSLTVDEVLDHLDAERTGNTITFTVQTATIFKSTEEIREDSAVLRAIAGVLKSYDNVQTTIEVHTDSRGSDRFNEELTADQGAQVVERFESLGVDVATVQIVPMGESEPVESNRTDEGVLANQRFEFTIMVDGLST